ncbi:hypothetical protein LTR91_013396 [Friedmanniomyces endolithicus]|uniref:Uncharacterized protein n=1 Tax=Friedmanniomyces endolithicus TaxID=329885 RepID=A0AAN6KDM0_9PEZI|nr:hypothetical protein LTR94_002087 [Friedmanniomyces endolithicus]KAK0796614.1 hypothetical protein LTR59_007095 [Friedmanniomyces endolithicus]KAK0819770.1 hypothetical protein LTR38_000524 [Friedmanniomyces endolithicus]KAK0821991.1 hypothetical protein LTR75_000125 [Friedmanniomyces endolithicus]KAK0845919.1 hypothetical protein LTR03_007125 [Friedmanniomyces endolithicus]
MTQNWNGWASHDDYHATTDMLESLTVDTKDQLRQLPRTRHLHTGSHNRGSRGYRILILFGSLVLEFMRKRPIFARDARRNTIDVADAVWFAASPQETEQAAPIKFAMSSLQFGSQCRGSRSLQTSLPSFPAKFMRKRPNFVRDANPPGGQPSRHRNTRLVRHRANRGLWWCRCWPTERSAADCGKSVVESRCQKLQVVFVIDRASGA